MRRRSRNMIRLMVLVVVAAVALAGCGGGYGKFEGPAVDLAGVDPVKHNKDMGECTEKKRQESWPQPAGMITKCMESRGYVILTPKG